MQAPAFIQHAEKEPAWAWCGACVAVEANCVSEVRTPWESRRKHSRSLNRQWELWLLLVALLSTD